MVVYMCFYYRVELYDYNKMATTDGFVVIINVLLLKRLNLTPLVSDEEFALIVGTSEDPEVKKLGGMMKCLLEDMKPPEDYTSDKSNRYCLFTEKGFAEREMFLEVLSDYVDDYSPHLALIYTEVELPPEVILYKDENQIVVSKETYEKYAPLEHHYFNEDEDDDDYYDDERR